MTNRVGQQLGSYRLLRLLGQGGFAEVYLGEHVYLETQAAIKILHTQIAGEDVDSFRREARTIARLVHPHIVRVFDFGIEGETPFLVMDYAPNGTVRKRHPKGIPLPLPTILGYVKQVAEALQYAHDEHFIHRDIKPENLLIGRRQEVLLSDFGIALIAQTSRSQSMQDVAGTASYMAPEQFQGKPRPASDQYSFAVMVYEWLTGACPFHGSFTEVASQHLFVPPPPLREKLQSISPMVEQVVMTALAKDPYQRFGSVQAFATAFEQASQVDAAQAQSARRSLPPSDAMPQRHAAPPPTEPATSPSESFIPTELITPASRPPIAYEQSTPPSQTSIPTYLSAPSSQTAARPELVAPSSKAAALPTKETSTAKPSSLSPDTMPPQKPQKQGIPQGRVILLIGLALLLVVAGVGLVSMVRSNQIATNSAIATATSQANIAATPTTPAHAGATVNASNTTIADPSSPQVLYNQATAGNPILDDQLNGQSADNWDEYTQAGVSCTFTGNAYHVIMQQTDYVTLCFAHATNFSNFAFQVQMTIIKGDGGGLIFRANKSSSYRFRVSQDGTYDLISIDANNNIGRPTGSESSSAIKTGLNQPNLLTVVARGSHIYLYVNKQYLTDVSDSISSSGMIGLFAVDFGNQTEVAYTNAQVWTL